MSEQNSPAYEENMNPKFLLMDAQKGLFRTGLLQWYSEQLETAAEGSEQTWEEMDMELDRPRSPWIDVEVEKIRAGKNAEAPLLVVDADDTYIFFRAPISESEDGMEVGEPEIDSFIEARYTRKEDGSVDFNTGWVSPFRTFTPEQVQSIKDAVTATNMIAPHFKDNDLLN